MESEFLVDKKSPYGTYILKDALPYLFPEGSVRVSRNSVRERLRMGDCHFPETYFFVGMFFKIDQGDFATLLEEVENGNSLFVSADLIPDTLFSIVGIEEGKRIAQGKDYLRGFEDKAYSFASNHTSFRLRDSFNGEVLGYVNQVEIPNFVKVPYGEGVIYCTRIRWDSRISTCWIPWREIITRKSCRSCLRMKTWFGMSI